VDDRHHILAAGSCAVDNSEHCGRRARTWAARSTLDKSILSGA
jgi:hypothetical protein